MVEPEESRYECNKRIVDAIAELVEKHPQWRFHQILMNCDIEVPGEDRFYEESHDTWAKLKTLVLAP